MAKELHVDQLVEGINLGDTAVLARAVSVVENCRTGFEQLLSRLHSRIGSAHRIGITGPPGAGKSTMTESVTRIYRRRGFTVGVVAVDPTSPFTGGALLGDRIRMESLTMDDGVFIRSMASRGAVGGLATTTKEVCDLIDAFGFDRIIIETVGVGQSELAVAAMADTAALVLVPESGDGVQVLKAGLMEIADIYAINKADRPGAEKLAREVQTMVGLRTTAAYTGVTAGHGSSKASLAEVPCAGDGEGWICPVLLTSALKDEGIEEFVDAIELHREYLAKTGQLEEKRRQLVGEHVREVVNRAVQRAVWKDEATAGIFESGVNSVASGNKTPYDVASRIVAGILKKAPVKVK